MRKQVLKGRVKVRKAMNANITTNTTTSGEIIDTRDYKSVMFAVSLPVRTDGTFTPVIQDGDAANLSDAAAVDDVYLQGLESAAVVDALDEVATIGYAGKRRYVRLQIVSSGVTTGGRVVAHAILEGRRAPVTQGVGA